MINFGFGTLYMDGEKVGEFSGIEHVDEQEENSDENSDERSDI